MANEQSVAGAGAQTPDGPDVRTIGIADLWEALARGFADFKEMPTHVIFVIMIYPVVMLLLGKSAADDNVLPLVFPLLAGYTLVGPLVATGMYELSRRRENGLDTNRLNAFQVFRSPNIKAIAILGGVLLVIYFAWLFTALAIYKANFDSAPPASVWQFAHEVIQLNFGSTAPTSTSDFLNAVLTSSAGWSLVTVGCGVGLVFAVAVLALSVVSFPMLIDRNVGALKAAQTSIRAVLANPIPMAMWGIVVAIVLVVGSLPFFVGLAVALPVLGHASWHLYRKVIAP